MTSSKITELTRRDVVDLLLGRDTKFHGRLDLIDFLGRVWDLGNMPSQDHRFTDAAGDIWQHMVRNDDWDYEYLLLQRLELLGCSDAIFLRFVETCVDPTVTRGASGVENLVTSLNSLLEPDGYILQVARTISGRPVYEARRKEQADSPMYEIALSFAGEDRAYVEEVARRLHDAGVEVFYDGYEQVTLWGKDLVEHLDLVFRGQARYCVMFISADYAQKKWPTQERRSALARALSERTEYILPARFDDSELPGLRPPVGYVDLRTTTPPQLVEMILTKLGRPRQTDA
jgi:hypothetical protein